MRLPTPRIAVALLGCALGLAARGASPAGGGAPAAWWRSLAVRDLAGAPLEARGHWIVVVFLGQECPVSNASIPVLNKLAGEFGPRGFSLVGAYVDPTVGLAVLRAHAAEYAVGFATADDRDHRLARAAGATYTPEVAVFSERGERLYLGRIDDRVGAWGAARPAAAREDLREVLRALASGARGPFPGRPGYGCALPEAVRP
ncbi:MAG TPA: redoxin domain-containing protein [Opitutaceae bacterium]|jgi:hypothetical protein